MYSLYGLYFVFLIEYDAFFKLKFVDSYRNYYADMQKCERYYNIVSKYCVSLQIKCYRRLMGSCSGKRFCKVKNRKQFN